MKTTEELAREAKTQVGDDKRVVLGYPCWCFTDPALEAFRYLVRNEALEEAAIVCGKQVVWVEWPTKQGRDYTTPTECAEAIRALKAKPSGA